MRCANRMVAGLCLVFGGCSMAQGPAIETPAHEDRSAEGIEPERVRIVALNVGMLPEPLGRDNAWRAQRIADRLLTQPGPDVIVLIEVFDETARATFTERLRATHPWMVRHAGGDQGLREDSGIFVASRVPFVEDGKPRIAFKAFRNRGPALTSDHWCAKGVLGTELDLGRGRSLCVFAAHLQADYARPGQYAGLRARQLGEIKQFATGFVAAVDRTRTTYPMLVGDLNVCGEKVDDAPSGALQTTAEYERLADILLNPTDLFRRDNPSAPGWTWNHDPSAPGAEPGQAPQRLDYALALESFAPAERLIPGTATTTRTVTLASGLSDHRAIAVELAMLSAPVLASMIGESR